MSCIDKSFVHLSIRLHFVEQLVNILNIETIAKYLPIEFSSGLDFSSLILVASSVIGSMCLCWLQNSYIHRLTAYAI
jgi:hypothetical protein